MKYNALNFKLNQLKRDIILNEKELK